MLPVLHNVKTVKYLRLFNKLDDTVICLLKYSNAVRHCTNQATKKKEKSKYKDSCIFQKTKFPQSLKAADRIRIEKEVQEKLNFTNLYDIQRSKKGAEFILHDGPPYANGSLHLGHALNKILKDIVIRSQLLLGKKIHFKTGWDCHGLPIELAAVKTNNCTNQEEWKKLPPLEIRRKAQKVATENVKTQKDAFKRWGIMTNWDNIYTTYNQTYIAKELRLFGKLYETGYIFRANLPVHFSPSSRTSLAESELVYKEDHVSASLFVGMPLKKECLGILKQCVALPDNAEVLLAVWTTTPWTLPMNVAVFGNNKCDYLLLERNVCDHTTFVIWGEQTLEKARECFNGDVKIIGKIPGELLHGLEYHHPIYKYTCPVLATNEIKPSVGTGLTHSAPTHGKDDFVWAMKHNLRTDLGFVDDKGNYKDEAGPKLSGKSVLDEGNQAVIDIINSFQSHEYSSVVLQLGEITHQYPYDWRTNKPVMQRASSQFFFDVNRIKDRAVEALSDVHVMPEHVKTNMITMVKGRPYWCISRQRSWGVPIPVFYNSEGKAVAERSVIDHVASLIEKDGCDIWWSYPEEKLLPPEYVEKANKNGDPLPTKGTDILDIWFDSGATNHCVLDGEIADICVEGVDQDSGWFQSSLLLSVATTGKAPYRNLFVHNFAVDDNLRKMSKSLGNVVSPDEITELSKNTKSKPISGVNILRLWAAQSNVFHQIKMGHEVLQATDNNLANIRQPIRFCLSAISDLDPAAVIPYADLNTFDKYILWKSSQSLKKVWKHYQSYEIYLAVSEVLDLIQRVISKQYMNARKCALYCEPGTHNRRSFQTAVYKIFPYLLTSFAPVLPHLAEEAASYYNTGEKDYSIFLNGKIEMPSEWDATGALEETFNQYNTIRELFLKVAREKTDTVDTEESYFIKYQIVIRYGAKYEASLKEFQKEKIAFHSELTNALKVSKIQLQFVPDCEDHIWIEMEEATEDYCFRCHRYAAPSGSELCARCEEMFTSYKESRMYENKL